MMAKRPIPAVCALAIISFFTHFRIYFTLQLDLIRLCDSILKVFPILF